MTSTETFFEPYTTSYRLAIATVRPLLEEHLDLALRHLFRKVPSLRVCIGDRDGEKWLREMTHESIDLEMLSGGRTTDILSILQQYMFDKSTGPLWCVKVKPGEMKSDPEFKHVYDLFLGVNHAITDGMSNVRICSFLVQFLDAVIGGALVDDKEQLGVLTSDKKTQELIQENVAALEADPQLRSHLRAEYQALHATPSLLKATVKGLEDEQAETRMISVDLEEDVMSSFVRQCRAEGVTVNSAFTALANIALVDVLAGANLLQESYGLRSDHVLNARRYWEGDTSKCLGCHIALMPIYIETPRNAGENFWRYAKTVHEKLHEKIKSGKVMEEEAVQRFTPDIFSFQMEFGLTNMGDVTQMLTTGGQNVLPLHLLRSSTIHNVPVVVDFFIHTFRGCLTSTLLYNTSFITPEIAQKYSDKLFHHLVKSIA